MQTKENEFQAEDEETITVFGIRYYKSRGECSDCQTEVDGICEKPGEAVVDTRCKACSAAKDSREKSDQRLNRWLAQIPEGARSCEFKVSAAQRIRCSVPLVERAKTAMSERRSIVFQGPAGIGKTSLAGALIRQLYSAQWKPRMAVCWLSAFRLLRARQSWPLGKGECPEVERAIAADLFVLDDLGQEPKSELSAVADVIFTREEDRKPTWVTTGFSKDAIANRYGGGVARRVFEGAEVIEFAAP